MAKVVTEVGIGAAAIGAGILMPGIGAGLVWMTAGMQGAIQGALFGIGASSVMAGIADAIKPNQGGLAVGVSTPIGPWGYIYGTQKVGGVEIFRQSNSNTGYSTTSNWKQLHRVYALACHPCVADAAPFQLRIDGKQVMLQTNSHGGWISYSPTQVSANIIAMSRDSDGQVTIQLDAGIAGLDGQEIQIYDSADNTLNGIWLVTQNPGDDTTFTFISGGTPTPGGTNPGGIFKTLYADYQDKIYVEFLNGNHTATFPTLLAAGTNWSASDLCLGRTLVYVQMGLDASVFPSSIPNVSFVMAGKNNIYDPRDGSYGFKNNPALCIADFLCLPATQGGFGLTMGTDVPNAPLVAAANICDEVVALAGGGGTARYTCDTFFQLNNTRGAILKDMLTSCAGRITYQGGQYSIAPGAWVSPTLQLSDADLVGPIKLKPRLSIRDTCNGVKGTYVSPENNYQQADVPPYMQDADHGYVADPWLAEDHGERIFKEANFPCTNSSAVAQRLAKIALLRTRYQMRLTIQCNLKAYQAVALDVIQLTHPRYTWVNKSFEVLASRFPVDKSTGAPRPYVELDLAETDSSIFDWTIAEQLTPQGYAQPSNVGNSVCQPPDDVSAYSGPGETVDGIVYPSTINTTAAGLSTNSIYVRWNQPNDANVVSGGHLELQWQPQGAAVWNALPNIAPTAASCFITGVTDSAEYMVQMRAVNVAGVPSPWIIAGPVTVSKTLSSLAYSGIPVATAGTLTAQAFIGGTAAITCLPFTASVGSASVTCTPTPSMITGLNQAQLYYVYYIDPSFAGGAIAPIATQNPGDFENKIGYFLIGSIVTPSYTTRYEPSSFTDLGSAATSNPASAYDNDVTTAAVLYADWQEWNWTGLPGSPTPPGDWTTNGDCRWQGFPAVSPGAATTLHFISKTVDASNGTAWGASVVVKAGGTTLGTFSPASTEADQTVTIPSGTDLSTVTIEAQISWSATPAPPGTPGSYATGEVQLRVYETYIQ